ncbi:MAG: hypothetical protein HY457_00765 [Parcubacteria group bacterium]|nr:hypothetical protein [Parcubacteria group bacterium]
MKAQTEADAYRVIEGLNVEPYVKKAIATGKLTHNQVDSAVTEYRHFLFLVWLNRTLRNEEFVVPTKRADSIWHEHILDSPNYRKFCNDLVGEYIDHTPGLEEDTPPFNRAVEHTRRVHRDHALDGFLAVYLGISALGDLWSPSASAASPHVRRSRADDIDEAIPDVAGKVADAIGGDGGDNEGNGGGGHEGGGGGGGNDGGGGGGGGDGGGGGGGCGGCGG